MALHGIWLLLVPVLLLLPVLQGAGGQVCDWEPDSAQGLDPRSLEAGARRLSVLRDLRDSASCREACCSEPRCQLALLGVPADGRPECWLVGCLQDGRDVCLLQPASQFTVSRKKNSSSPPTPAARNTSSRNTSSSTDACRRPKVVGSCRASFPRFYYDVSTQGCRGFIYGGCENNGNNFPSQEECEEACQGVTDAGPAGRSLSDSTPSQPTPAEDPVSSDVSRPEMSEDDFAHSCGAEPEMGPCRAAIPQWFYNSSSHTCQLFIYGGCRGNKNNYASKQSCKLACTVTVLPSSREVKGQTVAMETKDYTERCTVAPEAGPCRAAFPRFFYRPSSASCHSFIYGGCQGNKNRYETLGDCMAQCDARGHLDAHSNDGKRDHWTPAFFLIGTLAVISVLVLTGLIAITLHRSGVTRRVTSFSDKEELLPQQGESLSIPESPQMGRL